MAEEGYIPLARAFFDHHFWCEERTYSRAEAWLDLIQQAAFRPRKKIVSGQWIDVPRGGIVASVRFLSDRWKWSNTKVCLFLENLATDGMITTEKRQGVTVIFLCKYEQYNPTKTTAERRESDDETTRGRRADDEIEEGNKERKGEGPRAPEGFSLSASKAIASGAEKTATLDDVLRFAAANAIPENVAKTFFHDCDARPLHRSGCWSSKGGDPIANWKSALRSYASRWEDNNRRQAAGRMNGNHAAPPVQPPRKLPSAKDHGYV